MAKINNAIQEGWQAVRSTGLPVLVSWEKIKQLGLIEIYQQHGQIVYVRQAETDHKYCFNLNEIKWNSQKG